MFQTVSEMRLIDCCHRISPMAAILGSFVFVFLLMLVVDSLAVRVGDGHVHDLVLLRELDVPDVL